VKEDAIDWYASWQEIHSGGLGALCSLCSNDTWYMDVTFSVAPHLFKQLYVIRADTGDSPVSCVYALLTGKHQGWYEELLHHPYPLGFTAYRHQRIF